jgi:hypothetical protein
MQAASSGSAIAQAYFDRFARAFHTFDGDEVADLFATPGVALRGDGSIVALTTKDDWCATTKTPWIATAATAAFRPAGVGSKPRPSIATACSLLSPGNSWGKPEPPCCSGGSLTG